MTAAARRLVVSQVDTAILALVSFCKFPESVLSVTQAKQVNKSFRSPLLNF